jgi:hypothetical protein
VPDRDHVSAADENMGFAKVDLLLDDLGGAQNHKQRFIKDFDLRTLVRPKCILDRKVVQPELLLDDLQDIFARLVQADPNEAARTFGERAALVDVEIDNAAAIFVSCAGHNHAHRGLSIDCRWFSFRFFLTKSRLYHGWFRPMVLVIVEKAGGVAKSRARLEKARLHVV